MILKEDILAKASEKEIMEFYWGEALVENKAIYRNPMRHDSDGTCYFKWHNNKYIFVDRARGIDANFDCFKYVMWHYGCGFYEAVRRINDEMLLESVSKLLPARPVKSSKTKSKARVNFKIKLRKWNQHDIDYWAKFGITISTIDSIIKPVKSYKSDLGLVKFRQMYKYDESDPCYAYIFKSSYKLYRPFSKKYKWRSNTNNSDIFGLNQLPHFGKDLYICSGGKDMFCLWEMGFNAIAPQSESSKISEVIIDDLKARFKNIYIIYDNDNTGITMSSKLSQELNITNIILPHLNDCKDIAELCEVIGIDNTKNIINERSSKSRSTSRECTTNGTTTNRTNRTF